MVSKGRFGRFSEQAGRNAGERHMRYSAFGVTLWINRTGKETTETAKLQAVAAPFSKKFLAPHPLTTPTRWTSSLPFRHSSE